MRVRVPRYLLGGLIRLSRCNLSIKQDLRSKNGSDYRGRFHRSEQCGQSGQSIIQVLIAVGIMGIVMATLATMIELQTRETRGLGEKIGALSLKSVLTSTLANGAVCLYAINHSSHPTFDSSSTTTINAASIPVTQIPVQPVATSPMVVQVSNTIPAAPDSATLFVSSIELTGFQGSGTTYTANWQIDFDQTKLVHGLRSLAIPVTLTVNNSTPTATTIIGCMLAGSGSGTGTGTGTGGTCPTGQFMIGVNADGTPKCTTNGSQPGTPCVISGVTGITASDYLGQRCCLTGSGNGGHGIYGTYNGTSFVETNSVCWGF